MTAATQFGFYIDTDRCVGCHACELACASTHGLEPGLRWRKVLDVWDGSFPEVSRRSFSISCMQCEKPSCLDGCPEKAIAKRAEDGIVIVDPGKCTGCRTCGTACPFGVPRYGRSGIMRKCSMCIEIAVPGSEPPCAATCPGEALKFGTMEILAASSLARSGKRLSAAAAPCQFVSGRLSGSDILRALEKERAG
jgi:anaerobic dimethyl sulfoxide reductase subunit B (iron-sulfur subunit)